MSEYTIGRIGLVLRGAYSSTTTYQPLDVVTYNGGSYACKTSCTNISPTNTQYWQVLAQSGAATAHTHTFADVQRILSNNSTESLATRMTYLDTLLPSAGRSTSESGKMLQVQSDGSIAWTSRSEVFAPGSTITGSLTVQNHTYFPFLDIQPTSTNTNMARMECSYAGEANLQSWNDASSKAHRRILRVRNTSATKSTLADALELTDITDNVLTNYRVFHEGNPELPAHAAADSGKLLRISSSGNVEWANISGGNYTLPAATSTTLGGVKIGTNLSATGGVLSVNTASSIDQNGTTPVTGAAVHTAISSALGDVETLLAAL